MTLDPAITAALAALALAVLGGLGALLKAWGEGLIAELKLKQQQTLTELRTNTKETAAAKHAAEKAADQHDLLQRLTAAQLELDDLRRKWNQVLSYTACQACRDRILASAQPVADRRQRYDVPPQEPTNG